MKKVNIYKAIEKNNEDCCPRCEDVYYNSVGYIQIKNVEYPIYYCEDCKIYFVSSDIAEIE